jgi:hypothetical protein
MLTEEEKGIIQNSILQDIRVKRIDFTGPMDKEIYHQVQSQVFGEFGVMCPHSDNWLEQADHSQTKRCKACGCLVFPNGWRAQLNVKANPDALFPHPK